jgi:hypothetical protein
MIGDVLVEREAGSDREAIKAIVRSNFIKASFARGFALGAASVIKCGGVPAYLLISQEKRLNKQAAFGLGITAYKRTPPAWTIAFMTGSRHVRSGIVLGCQNRGTTERLASTVVKIEYNKTSPM